MRFFVGVTDWDWWSLHASRPGVDEVNFWRPSPTAGFSALAPGEPFLFKLHAPRNAIAGGAFFSKFIQLPVSLAWDAFKEANGALSESEVKARISKYRRAPIGLGEDPTIGCILLEEPFFWPQELWIDSTPYFSQNIVSGKTFDSTAQSDGKLWSAVLERLLANEQRVPDPGPALTAVTSSGLGKPYLAYPRLGQGSFRILVTDAYGRRCAMTGEKTLPVLDAAHIKPYAVAKQHEISNGILLRSDLHTLFDRGYLGIDPDDHKILVSPRIREQFENGRHYYALEGQRIALPQMAAAQPSRDSLAFHLDHVYA